MTDRPTGNYTHERLIKLEDSHKFLICFARNLMFMYLPQDDDEYAIGCDKIADALKIRKEVGLND